MSLIVIDSSAVVSIMLDESDSGVLRDAMARERGVISALAVFEIETVILARLGPEKVALVRALLHANGVEIAAFDDAQAGLASAAYARFGKGRHPARLNMGDCAAYALARSLDAPLLYKGEDFARTDLTSALTPG